MPEDKIILDGMEFYGYHGVHKAEHELGQPFVIDVVLSLDLRPAGQTDDPGRAVDYAAVYNTVRDITVRGRFALLEALAERIAAALLGEYPVDAVRVRVKKPRAPIPGRLGYAAVEIVRKR